MVWDFILNELYKYLPQLAMTFLGVLSAFWMDRRGKLKRDERDRQDLLNDLRTELEESRDKLTGKSNLHFPDIWKSAISSGQIRLIDSVQVRKLAKVYRNIQAVEYEAKWVRQAKEDIITGPYQ